MLANLAPARRRFVLAVLGLALLGSVAVAVGVLRDRSDAAAPVDPSRPGPVLLVPGYGGSEQSLAPLAAVLRDAGRDVTVVPLPDRAQGPLDDQADALAAAVSAVRGRTGASSVDLVGYSAGGVVARLYVLEHGGAGQVRRLVTLGSPHHGTEVAALGSLVPGTCPTACQELAPDSALLARLDREPLPVGLVALSLWSRDDEVVVPPTSSVLAGVPSPAVQDVCPAVTVGHGGLPGDRAVQRIVALTLGTGPVPTSTARAGAIC
ncbi:lipase family alpha/beta hydrolase [Lapillicoccus jejuensis]|uniref:Triacylglycerol esterase/lipase EstA (Alpha/beta hydrolase family) n=1 Tax=Lapillicoccus jejuensis TaxID=402171 RepID=A0A542E6K3_9MICO|nr:alpha/beta fold hydrolase [Lapillicoccus jejuensis]TQJ10963.1 triacylglycerol esterase/lipase EstA (alpha/beta hydrolase family) [Lapillicoccus jejuensis]